jgi:hypothetical protein
MYTERVMVSGITATDRMTSEMSFALATGSFSADFNSNLVLN